MNYVYVCVSPRSWRELMRAWNLLRWSLKGNSTRLLPILVATCAAFCTRIWDRSSRGHPLPPATQAMFVFLVGINNLLDLIWLNVIGYNQGLLGSAFCFLRKLVYAIKLCSWIASVNLTWEDRHVPQSLTRKMSEIWAKKSPFGNTRQNVTEWGLVILLAETSDVLLREMEMRTKCLVPEYAHTLLLGRIFVNSPG